VTIKVTAFLECVLMTFTARIKNYVRIIQTSTFCKDVLIFPSFMLFPEDETSNFLSKWQCS